MYCSNCGAPLAPGLSYCNRCGASLKERSEAPTGAISAFLTAITLLGIGGLGIMLAGALILRRGAGLSQDLIGFFMLFTFLITGIIEVLLVKQLSRLTSSNKSRGLFQARPTAHEAPQLQAGSFGEPVSSVTENTTRTLEYLRREK